MMPYIRVDFTPIKEAIGFIKVLEWLTAAFAFGSCSRYHGKNIITLSCTGSYDTLSAALDYPFNLNQVPLVEANAILCNHTVPETRLVGNYTVSAEFFVTVAIMAFLYSMTMLLTYVAFMNIYMNSRLWPKIDFFVTVVFAVLWLVSSAAWAKSLQNMKDATGTSGIAATLPLCQEEEVACEVTQFASIRILNVSVVFGFLNMILWVGNTWFTYKETPWHGERFYVQQDSEPRRSQMLALI